jgi:hypothetical protein
MHHADHDRPPPKQLMEIAVKAGGCDLRTVRKYFDGGRVSPLAERAIRSALAELGLADPRAKAV